MTGGEYVAGAVFAMATIGAVLWAAALVARRRLAHLGGSALVLAYATIASAGLIAVQLVPGALGILSREAALAAAVLLLLAAWRVPRTGVARAPEPARAENGRRESRIAWAMALGGAVVVAAVLVTYLRDQLPLVPVSIDALNFHLSIPALWMQLGTIWQADQFTPELAHANYPQNGDLLYLHAMLPFEHLAFVRLTFVPYVLLTGVAVYAIARELGAPRPASVLAGVALAGLPTVAQPALDNIQTDSLMLSMFGTGILFGLRHARTRATSDLVIAGLALGISFGTKWYGVSSVVVAVAVWLGARLIARHRVRLVGSDGAIAAGLVALGGGFWLLRNLVASGNPAFPVRIAPFGVTLFDAPPDRVREEGGFAIADYLGQPDILREFVFPAFERTFGFTAAFLGAALVLAVALAVAALRGRRRRHRRTARLVLVLSALAALLAAAYVVTPYSALGPEGLPVQVDANTRYLVPALLVAAPLAAWAIGRLGRILGLAAQALLLVVVLDAVTRPFEVATAFTVRTAVLAAIGIAAVAALAWVVRRALTGGWLLRAGAAAACALALGALVVAGDRQVDRFDYAAWRADPVLASLLEDRGGDALVGLANTWSNDGPAPVLAAFGPRLGNEVTFVGPVVRELQQEYRSGDAFAAALRRQGIDLLVVGLGFEGTGAPVPEIRWARDAGYEPVARSPRLVLLRAP